MKYKSNLISTASGSLAGTTFSRNRYGQYMRNRSIPTNPNSARQNTVRTLLANLTQYWGNTLTSTQRDQWAAYAANVPVLNTLGDQIYLTGLNMFVRSNLPNLQAGGSIIAAGPVVFTLPEADSTFAVAISEATQQITVTFDDTAEWCDEDAGKLIVQMGKAVSPTINYFGGPWRFADSIDGDSVTPPTSSTAINCSFTCQEAQKVFCQARILRGDGRLSNPFRANCTVAA